MLPPPNPGLARDYENAMTVARRAKNWLFLLLLLMLLGQIGIFFFARNTAHVVPDTLASEPAVRPAAAATQPAPALQAPEPSKLARDVLWYLTAGINFLGVVLGLVLLVCLLLIVNIMMIRRHIGLTQVTSAWVWCLLLVLLLFPWQSFMAGTFTADFKIPGVLYSWSELEHPTLGAKFGKTSPLPLDQTILRWARFVVWPAVALILLLMVQAKSSRGVRAALGETEYEPSGEVIS